MRSSTRPSGGAARRAYDFAKWSILNAVYPPDARVGVTALAAELGLGRSPVREALLRLEAEGLVHSRPGGGFVVSSFTAQEVEDVLEARVLVENYTAAKSFANREQFRDDLLRAHARMQQRRNERDTAGFTEADRAFHEIIVDGAGNAVLSQIYRSLREWQTLFTSAIVRGRPDRMDAAIAEHERILERLAGDDESAFVEVVNSHLRWSLVLVQSSMESMQSSAQ